MTSNFIQITSPRERSRLRGRIRLLGGWISDVNRPRYRLAIFNTLRGVLLYINISIVVRF